MKKTAIFLCAVLVLGGGAVWWLRRTPAAAVQVQPTAVVARQDVRSIVVATARVVANREVEIKCKASGTVITLTRDVSDAAKAGDLLLELDPVDEQRAVAQAEAMVAASTARLEQTRQTLALAEADLVTDTVKITAAHDGAVARAADARAKAARLRRLLGQQLASQEECDGAEAAALQAEAERAAAAATVDALKSRSITLALRRQDIRLAEVQLSTDQLSLDTTRRRLTETKVYAPIDGVVSARSVQVGSIVSSGITNVGGGTAALTLADLTRIFALASVDESDIGAVAIGQAVSITVDSFPGRTFQGAVVRIATKGANSSNVVTFEVKIEVAGPGRELLKPEMTANIEIIIGERPGVIAVPAEALRRGRQGWTAQVVDAAGAASERQVGIGISDGTVTEVISGLAEGERVVLRGKAASAWQSQAKGMPPPPGM